MFYNVYWCSSQLNNDYYVSWESSLLPKVFLILEKFKFSIDLKIEWKLRLQQYLAKFLKSSCTMAFIIRSPFLIFSCKSKQIKQTKKKNKLLCNFIEIPLCQGCSPENVMHIFRTPFPKNPLFSLVHSFFIRASKFYLRLAVLICFHFWGWNVLISPTELCNATKKNIRLSTTKTHYFTSFILFLSNSAKNDLRRSSIFH